MAKPEYIEVGKTYHSPVYGRLVVDEIKAKGRGYTITYRHARGSGRWFRRSLADFCKMLGL